jgi:GNAT superfamily N-acetyltransferase
MPIKIHPTTASDSYESFSTAERAFTAINPILFHTLPLSKTTKELISQSRAQSFGRNPNSHGFKAVDAESGALVGLAQWVVHEQEEILSKSVEEEVQGKLVPEVPERRVESSLAYYRMLGVGRREALGVERDGEGEVVKLRKRVELATLFVDPDFQGRGIARQLLAWGIGEAEKLGLEMSLEATKAGRRLYESVGFEAVKVERFDARPFGVDIVDEVAVCF